VAAKLGWLGIDQYAGCGHVPVVPGHACLTPPRWCWPTGCQPHFGPVADQWCCWRLAPTFCRHHLAAAPATRWWWPRCATVAMLVFGLWPEEVARESIRKPFVAGQYVYSNQMIASRRARYGHSQSEIPTISKRTACIKTQVFMPDGAARPSATDNRLEAGRVLALSTCSNCHSLTATGMRPLARYFTASSRRGGNRRVPESRAGHRQYAVHAADPTERRRGTGAGHLHCQPGQPQRLQRRPSPRALPHPGSAQTPTTVEDVAMNARNALRACATPPVCPRTRSFSWCWGC
jgi:hypothetical protein